MRAKRSAASGALRLRPYSEVMRRFALLAALVALAAGGVGAGAVLLLRPSDRPVLKVQSRWSWHDRDTRILVTAGSLASDPRRGFLLFELAARRIDPKTGASVGALVGAQTHLFTTPDRRGPLRVLAASRWSWVVETADGYRAVLELGTPDSAPFFYVLGRRLDANHLPRLPRSGIAVPVTYGPARVRALLLVGRDRNDGYRLYGYLPGFALAREPAPSGKLHRPLLGPGRALYRIDTGTSKLVRVGTQARGHSAPWKLPPPCSTWAAPPARYVACINSIDAVRGDGSRAALLRQDFGRGALARWTFLALSPNRRTLLLEQDVYTCGTSRQGYFLPAGGGSLQPVVGDASTQSEPVGWLSDGSALVAAQSDASCEGVPVAGIYQAWPGPVAASSRLLVAATADAAALWGPG